MPEVNNVISTVIANIDGLEMGVIAGSVEFMEGKPTREAEGLDNGNIVIKENTQEAIGMIKFEVPSTAENIQIVKTIEGRQANTVQIYDTKDEGFVKVMRRGVTKNDSSRTLGTDGKITLEFIGTPLD